MHPAVVRITITGLLTALLWSASIVSAEQSGSGEAIAAGATPVLASADTAGSAKNAMDHAAASAQGLQAAESAASKIEHTRQVLQPKAYKAPSFGVGYYLQLLAGLAVVIALIYGCAWLMRRVSGGSIPGAASMRVIGSLPVGPKERVVLVQVGDTQMLLGVAPGSVNTLQVFSEPVIEQDTVNPFADKLKFALKQRGALNQRGAQ